MTIENLKSEFQIGSNFHEDQYTMEGIQDFLFFLEEKFDIADDKEFFHYFDWERTQSFIKELTSIKEFLEKTTLMTMDLLACCEAFLRDLKQVKNVLSHSRMRERNRYNYTDKPIVLYRGIKEKDGDPLFGDISWWALDPIIAKRYAGEAGSIFSMDITLAQSDEKSWYSHRKDFNEGSYTFGISDGNDGVDGGFINPTYFSIGILYVKKHGMIRKVDVL